MKKVLFSLMSILLFTSLFSQVTLRTKQFNLVEGVAIQGYDPVAYFVEGKALMGNPKIAATVEGVSYFFTTLANKNLFLKDVKKYEPQYGGWCAYAMGSNGSKVEIDPQTFKIVNGKLYLFFHSWINNTLSKWNADENNLRIQADKNWQKINL